MTILETERLILRRLAIADSAFILELLNDPAWLRFIGDKGVRTLNDARDYILQNPVAMYERFGFGLYLSALKGEGVPIGICGLIKRDALAEVELGFALLPQFWGKGYANEAATAVLADGKSTFGLHRIVAIASPDNDRSANLLAKLGFRFEKVIKLSDASEDVRLFAAEV